MNTKGKKLQLLVNADDFGRHVLINQAVAQCVEQGCLRSATLMPGGKAFDDAVHTAQTHPDLGVGIHFTLVNGYPVLPPEEIPSLVTADGVFYDDYIHFVKRFLSGKVRMEEVRRELAAQAEKVTRTGLALTHVDSHQHMHVLPGIFSAVLDAAEAIQLDAVRIPRTPLFAGDSGSLGQLIGRFGLAVLADLAGREAKRRGFRTPDHFAGIVAGEAVHEGHFRHIIEMLKPGATEVMMHPGADTAALKKACQWEHDFEAERDAIISTDIKELLQKKQVEVISFRDIAG